MLRNGRRFFVLLLLVLFLSCAYKPPADPNARPGQGLNFFPVWYDNMIGAEYGELYAAQLPVLRNTRIQREVEDLGMYLVHTYYGEEVPPFDFEFYVVNLDVINAFAFPGGKIFVFRGLLEDLESEAELAGVLSHELGHVVARHGTKSMSKGVLWQSIVLTGSAVLSSKDHENLAAAAYILGTVGVSLRMLKYSRDYEREADWIAIHNVYRAGYDPDGMVTLFEHFKDKDDNEAGRNQPPGRLALFLSTHPGPDERQRNANQEKPKMDLSRTWNGDRFGFGEMKEELEALPPAPKEVGGTSLPALSSMDSLAKLVADGKSRDLRQEQQSYGRQTIRIFVPTSREWTETGLDLRAGQRVELQVEPHGEAADAGPVKAEVRRGSDKGKRLFFSEGQPVSIPSGGRLYFGVDDSSFTDNSGWYVVTVRIY
jgi:Zn-dependent protease with chaperone function